MNISLNVKYVFLQLTFNVSLIQDNASKCYFWRLFVILPKPTLIWSSWHKNMCFVAIVSGHQLEISRDRSAMLGDHLSQKLPLPPSYNPKCGRNCDRVGKKSVIFCHMGDLTSRQNIQNPKNRLPKSCPLSQLQELEVRILCAAEFPHYNSDPVKRVS